MSKGPAAPTGGSGVPLTVLLSMIDILKDHNDLLALLAKAVGSMPGMIDAETKKAVEKLRAEVDEHVTGFDLAVSAINEHLRKQP
jgi:hypothetical protein